MNKQSLNKRDLIDRAEQAEQAVARVRALCMNTDGKSKTCDTLTKGATHHPTGSHANTMDRRPPMTSTPLSPDALAQMIMWKDFPFGGNGSHVQLDSNAAHAVINLLKPHLAVAQPVVNTAEELDALPVGSLVLADGREFYKTSYIEHPWILPYGVDRFGSGYLIKHQSVTVTHRPVRS